MAKDAGIQNLVKFGRIVSKYAHGQTDKHTYIQTFGHADCNTLHLYRGKEIIHDAFAKGL